MSVLIGIQARSASKRLPNKIYELVGAKEVLRHIIDASKRVEGAQVAVLGPEGDEKLEAFCKGVCPIFLGDPSDLITRYTKAIKYFNATHAVRITGDCPFMTTSAIQEVVNQIQTCDYVSNTVIRTMIEGLDIQAASQRAWKWLDENQMTKREHPFWYFDQNASIRDGFCKDGYSIKLFLDTQNPIFQKTSIDTAEDLARARKIWWDLEKGSTSVKI